jgi:pyrroline-5-carboxylate reductase
MAMTYKTLAFIGGGNMARSLIGGLVASGWPPGKLRAADPDSGQRELLRKQCAAMHVDADNEYIVNEADVILMAVKPQVLKSVAQALRPVLQTPRPLIISIAAGVRTADLERWLGGDLAVVRCMPNTPALIRSAATGLFANSRATLDQCAVADAILGAVGLTVWIEDETLLDAVTALSGSGPAYFLLVMEVMERAGVQLGLPPETARRLTLQTALGTSQLALQSSGDVASLRARVTSKGGTTERAIAELERGEIHRHFERAVTAAAERASELTDQLAEE